jgi:hypothetical protein
VSRPDPADPFPLRVASVGRILAELGVLFFFAIGTYVLVLWAIISGVSIWVVGPQAVGLAIILGLLALSLGDSAHDLYEAGPVD